MPVSARVSRDEPGSTTRLLRLLLIAALVAWAVAVGAAIGMLLAHRQAPPAASTQDAAPRS